MRRIALLALALSATASAAGATESAEDRTCNAKFATAARYLKAPSPEWMAMAHHSMDLTRKYPEDWTDDNALESKRRHRQDMDAELARIKNGEITIEEIFADVNACETRLGMPATTLVVGRQPAD